MDRSLQKDGLIETLHLRFEASSFFCLCAANFSFAAEVEDGVRPERLPYVKVSD
jgi:hypothetical protein